MQKDRLVLTESLFNLTFSPHSYWMQHVYLIRLQTCHFFSLLTEKAVSRSINLQDSIIVCRNIDHRQNFFFVCFVKLLKHSYSNALNVEEKKCKKRPCKLFCLIKIEHFIPGSKEKNLRKIWNAFH